jgi:diacylglycerol kinase
VSSDQSEAVQHNQSLQREDSVRLALLTLAILCGALGFVLSFLWIAALVLMGVLWGVMLAERAQRAEIVKGLVTEMVAAVVDEAKDVGDATASDSDAASKS